MQARAKPGNVPMPAQKIRTRRVQGIPTREQTADRAGILLWRAERPGRDQCVANVAMHFTTEVSHHPVEARERLGEPCAESNIADALGDAGRADKVEEEDDAILLTWMVVAADQQVAEGVRADQLNDRGQGADHEYCRGREQHIADHAPSERAELRI